METKLSKILNKLIDNDESLTQSVDRNSSVLNQLQSNLNRESDRISDLNSKFNRYDWNYMQQQLLGIKAAIKDYTAPSSISQKFDEISQRILNIEINGTPGGGSGSNVQMRVKENDPYIGLTDDQEIYSLTGNINDNINEKIYIYDTSIADLSTKFNELTDEIRNAHFIPETPGFYPIGVVKVADNDPYISINQNGEICSLSGNIDNRINAKITEYDAIQDLSGTVKTL